MKPTRGEMSKAVRLAFRVPSVWWLWQKGPMLRPMVRKRHALWWSLVAVYQVPVDEVARWGNRDKQAVHYGVKTASRVMAENAEYRVRVHRVAARLEKSRRRAAQ